MDLDFIVKTFGNLGGMALLAGVMLWQNVKMFDKQTAIIESNIKAMQELKGVIQTFCEKNNK